MPELPEVETVRRGLAELIVGKSIQTVSYDTARSFPNHQASVNQFMIGADVVAVRRRAKVLIIDLSTDYSLVIHLKMTGQLVYIKDSDRFGAGHPSGSLTGKLPDKSTRVEVTFKDASKLFFNDQRKFGWMRLLPTVEVPEIDFMKKVGPEPLEDSFLLSDFKERFKRKRRSNIKAALLDQTVIAGVGNIYADESLWYAKINPERKVESLSGVELKKLYEGVRYTMKLSIEKGGSTDKNYVNAKGEKGSYLQFAEVFRREGEACSRCKSEIIKTRVAGRGTHFCPQCQVL